MIELFLSVMNRSLIASYVILFVFMIRILFKKAPRVISYVLWIVVALRLVLPFSIESIFSLVPERINAVSVSYDGSDHRSLSVHTGMEAVNSFVRETLTSPATEDSTGLTPLQNMIQIGAVLWIIGIIILLSYSLVSILILKRQLKNARNIDQNIFEAMNIKTPFVLGIVRPLIYLPKGLSLEERNYILLHEQTHIRRKDNIIKIIAFIILSMHWMNPLVWISFQLMCNDMEYSCDESVLRMMNRDVKKSYAKSLLTLASGSHLLNGSPLAFSEGSIKGRVKNVLNYKKPTFWIMILAAVAVVVVSAGLLTNPKKPETALGVDASQNISLIWNYIPARSSVFPALPIRFDVPYEKVNITVDRGLLYQQDKESYVFDLQDKELTLNTNQSVLWSPLKSSKSEVYDITEEAAIKFDIIMKNGKTKSGTIKLKRLREDTKKDDQWIRPYTVDLVNGKSDLELVYSDVSQEGFDIRLR